MLLLLPAVEATNYEAKHVVSDMKDMVKKSYMNKN